MLLPQHLTPPWLVTAQLRNSLPSVSGTTARGFAGAGCGKGVNVAVGSAVGIGTVAVGIDVGVSGGAHTLCWSFLLTSLLSGIALKWSPGPTSPGTEYR